MLDLQGAVTGKEGLHLSIDFSLSLVPRRLKVRAEREPGESSASLSFS